MKHKYEILLRAVVMIAILAASVGVMILLASQRKEPAKAEVRERPIRVDVQRVTFENVPVGIVGYGEARARDTVSIAPEVPGRVVEVHPRLEVGEIIPKGEVLFQIDPRDYQARHDDAAATVQQMETSIERWNKQFSIDRERLETLSRSSELGKAEYQRVKQLLEVDQVGTQSGVDTAERAMNGTKDQYDQLVQVVDLYPIRIREAEDGLASARAMFEMAKANLDRTVVRAPFYARVTKSDMEQNEYVSPGSQLIMLADDSVIEISVPLDSRQARQWLRFGEPIDSVDEAGTAWFDALENVEVEVFWTEDEANYRWTGRVDRVEKFDAETRQLTVITRIDGADAQSAGSGRLPLVEGMFCKVRIPGKVAENVVKLPAECVGFDRDASGFRSVYVAAAQGNGDLRLKTVKVRESHMDGQNVYVAEGLTSGDLVITTRLVNPLENTLVQAANLEKQGSDS